MGRLAVAVGTALAAGVLVAGCGSPSALRVEGPAPTAGAATTTTTTAPALRPEQLLNIRNVDLRGTVLGDPAVPDDVKEILRDCDRCGLNNPTYADVTGDGEDDVIVPVGGANNGGTQAVFVYSAQQGQVRQVFGITGPNLDVRPVKGGLVVKQPLYRAEDPLCCPRGEETVSYRWQNQKFAVVERRGGGPGLKPYGEHK